MTDHVELIARAQEGDREAFEELFRVCYAPVYRFVLMRIKSADAAEDITQEVFIKLIAKIDAYRAEGPSLLPYLFVIARNKVIDYVRRQKPHADEDELLDLISKDPTPAEAAIMGEEAAYAIFLLNSLGEPEASIVRMKYVDELSTAEIARVVGKREDAVRQVLSRSLRRLRSLHADGPKRPYGTPE